MKDAVQNIKTIAKRELSGYFTSPVAYVFIVIFLLVAGFFTFMVGRFFENGEASLASFFTWHPWLYLFLVPAVGMRLWSEERRLHTIELLLTMPITAWQAIVGKFVASWLFLIICLTLTFPVVLTVRYLGDVDWGAIFAGYLGSALISGGFLAVACLTSSMTRNQVISFILSFIICLALIMVGWEPVTNFMMATGMPEAVIRFVSTFSVMPHFAGLQRGLLDSRDLLFFASLIGFLLFCTGVVIRNLRAG